MHGLNQLIGSAQISRTGSANKLVVFPVRTDPEPVDTARHRQPKRPVVKANPDTVILPVPHRLEMQRRMRRIGFELVVIPARERLNVSG